MAKSKQLKQALKIVKAQDRARKETRFNFSHEGKFYTVQENTPRNGSLTLIGNGKSLTIGAGFCLTRDTDKLDIISEEVLRKARKNYRMDSKFRIIGLKEEQVILV